MSNVEEWMGRFAPTMPGQPLLDEVWNKMSGRRKGYGAGAGAAAAFNPAAGVTTAALSVSAA